MIRRLGLLVLALGAGCGDDDGMRAPDAGGGVPDSAVPDSAVPDGGLDAGAARTLTLSFDGLPSLGDGFVYEGWLIVDDAPVSSGRFVVDESGALDPATFSVAADDADGASMFVLTIEPAVGDDPAPAATHVVAGAIAAGSATLSIDHPAALGDDFTAAAGTFILATPTSASMEDDQNGLWFLAMPGPRPSLELPTLPDGWVYEGWVVDVSGDAPVPTSTGRFRALDAADSDGAGPTAGPQPAPPFPGQDFIDPARDLTMNHMAVISIEPDPDDSPAPFRLKPLATAIGASVGGANPQTLNNVIGDNAIRGTLRLD